MIVVGLKTKPLAFSLKVRGQNIKEIKDIGHKYGAKFFNVDRSCIYVHIDHMEFVSENGDQILVDAALTVYLHHVRSYSYDQCAKCGMLKVKWDDSLNK